MSPIYKILLSLAAVFAVTSCWPERTDAQYWANGQAASYVIGQPGFGSNGSALNSTGFFESITIAVDPATGKVFVADIGNNRILRFPSIAALSDGATAEAVLGQPNFTTTYLSYEDPATANTFEAPYGIAIDASGHLWVADNGDNRILRFDNAATIASGAAASGVLGWPNLVSNPVTNNGSIEPPTAASFYFPNAVFCKGTTLWVSDGGNNRIVRFDNAASKANGANADAVFGTPTFTDEYEANAGTAPWLLFSPNQIYVDGSDNLWVTEFNNNRVMMFPNASTGGNNASTTGSGVSATLVLGQTNFYNNSTGLTSSTMNRPEGIYGDGAGDIYVADEGNNRILVFANAAHLSNGAPASNVLGQTDFGSNGTGDGASQLNTPAFLFVPTSTTSVLMAADAVNNRVLTYVPLVPLPLVLTGFTGLLQDNGQVLLQWQISVSGGSAIAGTSELQYATADTSEFNTVLSTQPIDPSKQDYSYVQVSPAPGINYYRLKLLAPDGSSSYSQIVTITVGSVPSGLSIYPSPAHSSLNVNLPQIGGTAEIDIYSNTGILMKRLVSNSIANEIDISRWAAGVYTVKVIKGGNVEAATFIKVN